VKDQRSGARELFAARLVELHEAAGSPLLESVATRAMARKPQGARWRVTGKRISDWKRGRNVPESADACAAVARKLIELALTKTSPTQVTAGLYNEEQWRKWWAAARAEPLSPASEPTTPSTHPIIHQIRDLNALDLEVHAALDSGAAAAGLDPLPAYVRREHDYWLSQIVLEAASGESRLAVLVGDSSTGKTRACWEAIQTLPPWWRLWHPIQPSRPDAAVKALRRVGPYTVIWLNEANHYLLTPGSDLGERVAAVLRELLRSPKHKPTLVLGTIWPEYWATLTTAPGAGTEEDPHAQARALLIGASAPVPDTFTGEAAIVARVAAATDPRLVEAFRNADHGHVTQYLAGVPVLLERYRNAPAAARALIETAMDARRLGHGVALPRALLEAGAAFYMTDQQWETLGEEWFDEALTYTAAPCRGVRGPLTRIRPRLPSVDRGQPRYRLADYLEQWGHANRSALPLPAGLWVIYAEHAAMEDLGRLAAEASKSGLHVEALHLWTAAAEAGDKSALRLGARALRDAGSIDDALTWYERAAGAGYADALEEAAQMLQDAARAEQAMVWYKRAGDAGSTFALDQAVKLLHEADRTDEALTWLRRLADNGDVVALRQLARARRMVGDIDGSVVLYQQAIQAGDSECLVDAARLLDEVGRIDEAMVWYRRAAEDGDIYAPRQAARMLQEAGRIEEALTWFDIAARGGEPDAFREAVWTLQQSGHVDDAIAWLQGLAEAGNGDALEQAVLILRSAGRTEVALNWLRTPAETGNRLALHLGAQMLQEADRTDEAIGWYQRAAERGNTEALTQAAQMLQEAGRADEAIGWYQRAAERGNTEALTQAAQMLQEAGRADEAIGWYQRAAERGNTEALTQAAQMLQEAGRTNEAVGWLQARADSGDRTAPREVARIHRKAGAIDQALAWYERAATVGNRQARLEATRMLQEAGRTEDALALFQRAVEVGETRHLMHFDLRLEEEDPRARQ
jgi:TPR repeat protein